MSLPQEPADLLSQARQRAAKLLETLLAQQAEMDACPPKLPPEQLAAGREALAQAIAACRRLLTDLDAHPPAKSNRGTAHER